MTTRREDHIEASRRRHLARTISDENRDRFGVRFQIVGSVTKSSGIHAVYLQLDGSMISARECSCLSFPYLHCPIDDHVIRYLRDTWEDAA